jgi:hypothetical protein
MNGCAVKHVAVLQCAPMATKIIRLNTQITPEQHKALLKLQEATGASLKWLVQRAITEYLERRKKEIE